jgi:hypothetical protein
MENLSNKKTALLLPSQFKKIGFAIMILAFVPALVLKLMNSELLQTQKELFKIFTLNAVIVGLFFVAWSRDRIEDEMTVAIRLRAVAWTFAWAVAYVVFKPVIDILFKDPLAGLSGQQLVLSMLVVYSITYYIQKIGR